MNFGQDVFPTEEKDVDMAAKELTEHLLMS